MYRGRSWARVADALAIDAQPALAVRADPNRRYATATDKATVTTETMIRIEYVMRYPR